MHDAVLVVCGGLLQLPVVPIAHELGLRVIMTDRSKDAAAMKLADEAVELDIYDVEGHVALVSQLQRRYQLRGVFAEGADVEVTVAAAAAAGGLPGIPVTSAMNTKHKARMRACLDAAGLDNPRWQEVSSYGEAVAAAERIGFPLMAKAIDNSASRGTRRVDAVGDLEDAVKAARAASTTDTVLLEECYQGTEQSVEILFDEHGRSHRLNIVDRPFASEGGFAIELGHVNPSSVSNADRDRLFDLAERAAAATGVRFGAFKADTILTADGPKILEVTARLSGGFDCQYTTPLSSGRNFIRAALRLAVGLPIDPADLAHRWHRHAAAWVAFPRPGVVRGIHGVDDVTRMPGVAEVFLRVAAGDRIQPYHDCAARPAFVIAVADDRAEAIRRAQAGTDALVFDIEG